MNSYHKNNNLDSKSNLSRDEISNYSHLESEKEKHRIEQKMQDNSFDSDAMEGWEALGFNTQQMKRLDNRFIPKSKMFLYTFSSVIGITLLLTGIFIYNGRSKNVEIEIKNDSIQTEILAFTVEKTDLALPDSIDKMKTVPLKEQIKAEQIILEFKEMNENEINSERVEISGLPLRPIQFDSQSKPRLERNYGNEIYLHDLKLVDYRNYRENPQIKTQQIILTGTTADRENERTDGTEYDWKEIDIPYIDYIDKTMKIFGRGNYRRALARYNIILSSYGNDVNANFYAGLCLYNLNEIDDAITHLSKCTYGKFTNFDEEAQWMIALSYERLSDFEKSNSIYQNIISQNGYYSSQAKEKLKK